MARPKNVRIKECVLHVRIDARTLQKLETICNRHNVSKANFVRQSIESACNQNEMAMFPPLSEENIKVIRLLMSLNSCLNTLMLQTRKIGVNINQIAKYNNTTAIGQGLTEEIMRELQNIKARTSILADGLERK